LQCANYLIQLHMAVCSVTQLLASTVVCSSEVSALKLFKLRGVRTVYWTDCGLCIRLIMDLYLTDYGLCIALIMDCILG
jgi:hypothetical protein